jgi:hypothetical protein
LKSLALTCFTLFLIGLTTMLAACDRVNTLSSPPAAHRESLAAGHQFYCSECHEDPQKGTIRSIKAFTHSSKFISSHRLYAGTDDRLCVACHTRSLCNGCHTNQVDKQPTIKFGDRPDREMPHRGDFMALHKIEGKLYPAGCYRCHGRDFNARCAGCHS